MTAPVIRNLLLAALLLPTSAAAQSAAQNAVPPQHNEATVAKHQAEMASGRLTSEHLTQEYITRILALDQNGSGVNAIIELNPDALVVARNADALRSRGVVLGPLHGIDRNPCGSSSGSSAAASANFATVSFGSETDGSIVCPANANGVVGIKPTVGLTSRAGVVPISHTQDTVGPHGRTVADAAAALSVIQSRTFDGRDSATAGVPLGWRNRFKRPA